MSTLLSNWMVVTCCDVIGCRREVGTTSTSRRSASSNVVVDDSSAVMTWRRLLRWTLIVSSIFRLPRVLGYVTRSFLCITMTGVAVRMAARRGCSSRDAAGERSGALAAGNGIIIDVVAVNVGVALKPSCCFTPSWISDSTSLQRRSHSDVNCSSKECSTSRSFRRFRRSSTWCRRSMTYWFRFLRLDRTAAWKIEAKIE